jgi:Carboxypeptidase regulatory-like domain/TonB-dependent Receptor Plug Domain
MKRCILVLSLCLLVPFAWSQSTNATISGGVTDPSGNFILNADVEIANDATGIIYSARTNGSGMYLAPILPPGHYHVQVSKPGFKTIIKADVILNVQSAVALNFVLPVGATSESVTVNASSSSINTTDASVSTVIDRKFVANMPLNGRSFQDLISMTPGVINQSPQSAATQLIGGSGDFSVNGQRTQSNNYTVDGVSANINPGYGSGVGQAASGGTIGGATALGTTQTLIPVDGLQEFRVQSSTYSAEYGRSPGGQFSLGTRSGTNVLHGGVFDYLRNNFFDANDWFNDHYSQPIATLRQNDFGGTLGGPVWIPKLYNGKDRTFFFVAYEGLRLQQPTAATIQYVPDQFLRQQAVPAIQPILNAFPVPNGHDYGTETSPGFAQFIAPYSLPSSIDSTSVRLDHSLTHRLSLFFRFGYSPSATVSRPYLAPTTTASNAMTYTLGATAQLTSSVTNEFRLGYARSESSLTAGLDNFGGATPIDLAQTVGASPEVHTEPFVLLDVSGIGQSILGTPFGLNRSRQWNLVDTVNVSTGHHNLKFGGDYRHIKSPLTPPDSEPFGEFLSPMSMLSGTTDATVFISNKPSTPLFNEMALFAQDDWRPHPRLSLSLGLRWELSPPPTDQHGDDAYTILGNINNPSSLALAPQGTPLWKTSWYDFAPRAGAAWIANPSPQRETVLRTGAGVFFDTANEIGALGYSSLGFFAQQFDVGVPIPYTNNELNVPISVTPPYNSSPIIAFPTRLQLPYTIEWNASIQQALGRAQSLTVSYVGANGRRLLSLQEFDLSELNSNFGTVEFPANGITSSYDALELQFQRSIARGLQALASYTWSHSIDFGSQSSSLPLLRGNSDFDVRDNFQAGVSWDLPNLTTRSKIGIVLNDWGLDARLSAHTAFPVTLDGSVTTDSGTGNVFNGNLNLVPNQSLYLHGQQYPGGRSINPASFCLPTSCAGITAPRNFARGFSTTQLNTALRREFHIHDPIVLQFRAEAFNIFNHPNFGYVDPTYTDATFGQATKMLNASLGTMASQYQQGGPRSMQFALRLNF